MQIAITTGEASGDRAGAQLARELFALAPDADIWGVGGAFMREAGVKIWGDSSRWGMVGAASALRVLPQILAARARLLRELKRRRPDLIIAVDAGGFHLGFGPIEGLLPWARRNLPGTRILYYFPSGSWRRTLRGTTLNTQADACATPFSWSERELVRLGANAAWVGHPLLDSVRPEEPVETFADRVGVDRERPVVGLLPGSRAQEITHILPALLGAATEIHRRVPGVQFLLALAPTVDRAQVVRAIEKAQARTPTIKSDANGNSASLFDDLRERLSGGANPIPVPVSEPGRNKEAGRDTDTLARRQKEWMRRAQEGGNNRTVGPLSLAVVERGTYDVMAASDVLLCASGTATLEAAILGRPQVIVYRMSYINALEFHLVKKSLPPYIGMPNILAQKKICPEYWQDDATPQVLAGEVIGLLLEPERLLQMRANLQKATETLGVPGGAGRAARMALGLLAGGDGPTVAQTARDDMAQALQAAGIPNPAQELPPSEQSDAARGM